MSTVYLKVELKSDYFQFVEVIDITKFKETENIYNVKFSKVSEFIETYMHEYINKLKNESQLTLRIFNKSIDICDELLDGYDNLVIELDKIDDLYRVYLNSICYDKVKSRQLMDTNNERLKTLLVNICMNNLNDSSLYDFRI